MEVKAVKRLATGVQKVWPEVRSHSIMPAEWMK